MKRAGCIWKRIRPSRHLLFSVTIELYHAGYGDERGAGCFRTCEKGLVVRSGTLLGYPTTVRVTIGTEEDNERFVEAIEDILQAEGVK